MSDNPCKGPKKFGENGWRHLCTAQAEGDTELCKVHQRDAYAWKEAPLPSVASLFPPQGVARPER